MPGLLRGDERKSHRWCFAKKAAAFFKISRSSLRVVGVASQSPDGERVELLVRMAGCHPPDECLLMLNVGRATETTLAAELPRAMRSALDRHRAAASDRILGPQGVQ